MTIEKGRSRRNAASFRRLNLTGTVLAFACTGNDVGPLPPAPPPPAIDAIFPNAAVAGTPDVTLTISGSNFVEGGPDGSHAAWSAGGDTDLLATTYVSSTRLTAVIPAGLLSKSVTAQVLLETGDIMGDLPLATSNAVSFVVTDNTDPSRTGTIIVHGQRTAVSAIAKGSREVSLDGGPWSRLTEDQSLTYSPVAPGGHQLVLSEPCTANHVPSTMKLTVSGGQTITISVAIPPDCE